MFDWTSFRRERKADCIKADKQVRFSATCRLPSNTCFLEKKSSKHLQGLLHKETHSSNVSAKKLCNYTARCQTLQTDLEAPLFALNQPIGIGVRTRRQRLQNNALCASHICWLLQKSYRTKQVFCAACQLLLFSCTKKTPNLKGICKQMDPTNKDDLKNPRPNNYCPRVKKNNWVWVKTPNPVSHASHL